MPRRKAKAKSITTSDVSSKKPKPKPTPLPAPPSTTAPSQPPPTPGATPDQPLLSTSHILHLITVRNKNQHRTQKWWKHLCLLRRGVRDLLAFEYTRDGRPRGWLRREEEERRERVRRGVREEVLGGAWVAFTNLIADPQFSPLGLVLVAALASVAKVVGLPLPAVSPPPPPLATAEAKEKEIAETSRGAALLRRLEGSRVREDVGTVVVREQVQVIESAVSAVGNRAGEEWGENGSRSVEGEEEEKEDEETDPAVKKRLLAAEGEHGDQPKAKTRRVEQAEPERKKVKKRRKKMDAIDRLFGDL